MQEWIEHIVSRLTPCYPPEEAREMAYWIIEEVTGLNRFAIRTQREVIDVPGLDGIIGQLLEHVPLQYIFGHTEWMGLDLLVNSATLIPRPETAEMVEMISGQQSAVGGQQSAVSGQRVLDIGTGSGCIALAIKHRQPEWEVTGVDISPEAIRVACANAERNHLEVNFMVADVLSDSFNFQRSPFNIIVSNPPYIRPSERETMTENTLRYEPQQALFVPEDDPLLFYRRIAKLHMAPELWLEINEHLGSEMVALMEELGYEAECIRDMYGKQRFIHAYEQVLVKKVPKCSQNSNDHARDD